MFNFLKTSKFNKCFFCGKRDETVKFVSTSIDRRSHSHHTECLISALRSTNAQKVKMALLIAAEVEARRVMFIEAQQVANSLLY